MVILSNKKYEKLQSEIENLNSKFNEQIALLNKKFDDMSLLIENNLEDISSTKSAEKILEEYFFGEEDVNG